jgi:hypothetical protein
VNGDSSDSSSSGAGAAYSFVQDARYKYWNQTSYAKPHNISYVNGNFGFSVALYSLPTTGPGQNLAVGAPGQSSVFFFTTATSQLPSSIGSSEGVVVNQFLNVSDVTVIAGNVTANLDTTLSGKVTITRTGSLIVGGNIAVKNGSSLIVQASNPLSFQVPDGIATIENNTQLVLIVDNFNSTNGSLVVEVISASFIEGTFSVIYVQGTNECKDVLHVFFLLFSFCCKVMFLVQQIRLWILLQAR